jgi:hypothetical protein
MKENRTRDESTFEQGPPNLHTTPDFSTDNLNKQEKVVLSEFSSTNEGISARNKAEETPAESQKRRKRKVYRVVRVSCVNCRQSKQACDEFRPCARCIRLGLEEMCVDAPSSRPRPLNSHIPTPNDKLFPKVYKVVDKLNCATQNSTPSVMGKYCGGLEELYSAADISRLLSPLLQNVEQPNDSFIARYYAQEGSRLGTKHQETFRKLGTESLEDTVAEALYELYKMMTVWNQDLEAREHQSNTKEELENTAKSHALFCYILKILKKFLQLWGVESFSDSGKRVLAIYDSLQSLACAKPETVARIRAYLPCRKVKLSAEQQHEFLDNIPMPCIKMSLRVDDSFHFVDFANREACDLFSASMEDLSILIGCRETLPVVMGSDDWIRKPMFLLRLLTENTLKRLEVYHIVTFDGSLYKCNVSCSVILGDNWEPDSYIFLLQNAERLGHDPVAGSFLHRVVCRIKSEREQNNVNKLTSSCQHNQPVLNSASVSKELFAASSSTVLHM